jgi:hypothetical protein
VIGLSSDVQLYIQCWVHPDLLQWQLAVSRIDTNEVILLIHFEDRTGNTVHVIQTNLGGGIESTVQHDIHIRDLNLLISQMRNLFPDEPPDLVDPRFQALYDAAKQTAPVIVPKAWKRPEAIQIQEALDLTDIAFDKDYYALNVLTPADWLVRATALGLPGNPNAVQRFDGKTILTKENLKQILNLRLPVVIRDPRTNQPIVSITKVRFVHIPGDKRPRRLSAGKKTRFSPKRRK